MIRPYTLGTQLIADPGATTGSPAYYIRKKRFIAYILTAFLLVLL